MKGIREKKQAKIKQNMSESARKPDLVKTTLRLEMEKKAKRSDTQDNKVNKSKPFFYLFLFL